MILEFPCKVGKVQLTEDGFIRIKKTLGPILWQSHNQFVTGFTLQPHGLWYTMIIYTQVQGSYAVEIVSKPNYMKLQPYFPMLISRQ